jgi:hypothetical protein
MPEEDVAEEQTTLRLLPTGQDFAGELRRACKRPLCGNEVDLPDGRSRPRVFCTPDCRNLYQRERDQARSNLLEARRLALQYEIDDTDPVEVSSQHRQQVDQPEESGGLPAARASYLALSLVAQALEEIRVDLQDGERVGLEEALARISRAKEEGDRLLRAFSRRDPS